MTDLEAIEAAKANIRQAVTVLEPHFHSEADMPHLLKLASVYDWLSTLPLPQTKHAGATSEAA